MVSKSQYGEIEVKACKAVLLELVHLQIIITESACSAVMYHWPDGYLNISNVFLSALINKRK
jgi:hypothetical protein